jgi:isoprene-epoxide---glutathione S-transferase
MISVYGYVPAWGLPDISPYVTKVVNYMTMAGIPFEWKPQDLGALGTDSPTAKLPYIIDDGVQVNDSTRIIQHLQQKYGDKLDTHLSATDKAVGLAFQRMVEEYTYWSGVIEPRWRTLERFEVYVPYIVGGPQLSELPPEVQGALLAFRDKIVDEFDKQGMGLRTSEDVLVCLQEDLDALSTFLGAKPFLLGEEPTSFDATIYSTVRHIADSPWDWAGRDYARSKSNLVAYADRMRARFDV